MWRAVVRWWRYLGAKAEDAHDERADPKIQLTQALGEARANHARLTERAAIVVAHQKHLQRQLERLAAEHERADGSARQALRLADAQSRQADPTKAAELLRAAEAFAGRVLDREKDIREVEQQLREAALATERAKAAVAANAEQLRQRVTDRERLLSTLDQAKMQESINAALEQISGPTGDQVPTLAEVERKIEARLARAQGRAELAAVSSDPLDLQMLEIEQAQRRSSAQSPPRGDAHHPRSGDAGDRRRLRRAEGARAMTGPSWPPPGTPPPPRPPAGPGYRSPVLLARVVVVAVAIGMFVAAAATIAVLDQMEVAIKSSPSQDRSQPDRLAAVDARRTALCRTVQLIDVVGLGLLAVWTRRLYGNLRPLGFNEPRFREVGPSAGGSCPWSTSCDRSRSSTTSGAPAIRNPGPQRRGSSSRCRACSTGGGSSGSCSGCPRRSWASRPRAAG